MNLIKQIENLLDSTVMHSVLCDSNSDALILCQAFRKSIPNGYLIIVPMGNGRTIVELYHKSKTFKKLLAELKHHDKHIQPGGFGRADCALVYFPYGLNV
jgi:hypothetical protein